MNIYKESIININFTKDERKLAERKAKQFEQAGYTIESNDTHGINLLRITTLKTPKGKRNEQI